MMFKQKPVAAAVSMALLGLSSLPALAQTPAAEPMQTVEVSGIRASLAKSLSVKKNATANVEVITAEDVGKMPDKNLADSLQRLPGVAVRTDYDEAEKVSMRGTNPDMSLILFNGHTVSGGDWYVADQGSSSRSTSLSLMPSSVLNQALVYKTSQANIADGGMAGTINVTTRKPLSQKERLSGVISGGMVYADLPGKTSPDLNASVNWKNEDNTLGIIVQGFAEKRYSRRDSVSRFAYGASSGWDVINTATMKGVTDASLAGTGLKAADLNGVRLPGSMSSEFVEGMRDRKGGMFSLQFRPNQDFDITATGFYSSMDANNHGRLTSGAIYSMLLGKNEPTGGVTASSPNTSSNGQQVFASIRNPVIVNETSIYGFPLKVLKSADIVFPAGTTPQYVGNSEGFYRDGANATSSFLDLDGKYRVSNDLTVKGLFSVTRGVGTTALDQGLTFARYGTGISYSLNGLNDAPDSHYIGAGSNKPGLEADGSGYKLVGRGASGIKTTDRESSLALDAEYKLGMGVFQSLEAGVRHADHKRYSTRFAPTFALPLTASTPAGTTLAYPDDFGKGLGGSNWDNTGFTYTPEAVKAHIAANLKPTTPEFERRVAAEIDLRERQSAFYLMQNLEGQNWSGNLGLRYVRTQVNANLVTPVPSGACPKIEPGKPVTPCAAYPGAINTAGDGSSYLDGVPFNSLGGTVYYKTPTERTFNNLLPSLNLRYEIRQDMIGRFGASRTIGRQNYNVLGAAFGVPGCNANGCSVTGPNPDLHPMTSNNIDMAWAWYFAPRSLVSVDLFHSKIDGYVKTGANPQGSTVDLVDPKDNIVKTFFINTSSQQGARISGIEVAYEQPIGAGFGFQSNVSRAKTKVDDGRPMVGASEWAANLGGYFENDVMSARLVYNYRGKYVNSSTAPAPTANSQGQSVINGVAMPTAPTIAAGISTLAFSFGYNLTNSLKLTFDATNLLNQARAQYRYSEEEQQKLDSSGRQYYVNLKYKF
ncbi:MAG: TonB-dependent receptor [Pseudomonadota bacterium]|nr:TonB-dependent receptor [Pseudomonadota bacterium]